VGELESKLTSLESNSKESINRLDSKIDTLEAKIDETLTESISVLKQAGRKNYPFGPTIKKIT
jgi:phosphate uptake regulator